jgi:hypothetical protein
MRWSGIEKAQASDVTDGLLSGKKRAGHEEGRSPPELGGSLIFIDEFVTFNMGPWSYVSQFRGVS